MYKKQSGKRVRRKVFVKVLHVENVCEHFVLLISPIVYANRILISNWTLNAFMRITVHAGE